jgi:hypothetical protein
MKLCVAVFTFASVWHFVQGQEKSTSLRGSYAEAEPAGEDEIASSGDIMNSQVQSSHDSTTFESEAIPSLPDFLCPVADRYKTEAGDSGDKIALKFYPGDDPVETWAIVIACNMALQELYNDLYPGDVLTIHYDTVDNMELVIPDKQAIFGNTTLGDIPDQAEAGPAEEDEIASSGDIMNSQVQSSHDSTTVESEAIAIPSLPEFLCPVADRYKTEAGDSGDKIALKFYPGDDPVETWTIVIACNVALQELYNDLYPGDVLTIHYDIVDNMELVIPDKQAFFGNTTLGDIPVQEHEGAASLCSKAYPYRTQAGDSGDKIALKFYPGDDPLETWASIIACNMALQVLYNDLYPGDEMTIHYDIVDNMELVIPDKQAFMQAVVIGNTTTGELVLDANTNATDEMNLFDDEDSGGRMLMTEGSIKGDGRRKLQALTWFKGNAASWAWDCDFRYMGDYKQVGNVRGDQCDPLCAADSQCTHFSFTPNGICYLKRGGAFKSDANVLSKGSGVICGIKITPYTKNYNKARWMSDLPDASYLHDLLLPGAHNAIAGPQSATGYSQCQDQNIMGLLNRGLRYFDFRLAECRPKHYNSFAGADSLCFWHGEADGTGWDALLPWKYVGDYLDLNLDQVAWELYNFLRQNPREVITVKISLEHGHPEVDPNRFLQRVEKYFQGHHEWWVHPGVWADNTSPNIRLRDVRGRIVVLWDCNNGGLSGWGLNYNKHVDKHPGIGAYDNVDQAFGAFRFRSQWSIYSKGFYEVKSAWMKYGLLGEPSYKVRTSAELMNPKVTDLLFNGGSMVSQKGFTSMDFPTDQMINQIVDITRVRQFRWLTPFFNGYY